MKSTKMNIGVALSRNYDKISLDILEEVIEHETEEQLKQIIKDKLSFLKGEILKEFGETPTKTQTETTSTQKPIEKATEGQKSYLKGLGFEGDINLLSKAEASKKINDLLQKGEDY